MQAQESHESNLNDNETGVQLWSLKLITGQHIITEMYDVELQEDSDEMWGELYMMVNPIVVEEIAGDGGELTTAKPYDKTTDDDTFEIYAEKFMSEPKLVNKFYTAFYVKAIIFTYVKKVRAELAEYKDLPPEEFKQKEKEFAAKIDTLASFLEERFNIGLEDNADKAAVVPTNVTLH
jgi:hypothetical protein